VPADNQGAAELWAVDGTGLVKRLAGGTAWANVTLDDAITGNYQHVNFVALNGKLYIAYDSAVNRLHVWDPADAKVRRVGVATGTNPPTSAVAGAGAVTDTRTYKVQWLVQAGGVTIRQSNLTPASTPALALAAQNATITRPATPATEGITHWRIFAASTDGSYRLIVDNIAIATTTGTDSFATLSGSPPSDAGAYTPPPSAKYLIADDTRVIMGGAWETTAGDAMVPSSRRVWWTSRLGSSDIGDDERISNTSLIKGYDDIEESVNGIGAPVQGSFYVFSYDGQWKFVPTGNVFAPYNRIRVTGGEGCIQHKTIVTAEDEDGDPALYWASKRGPVRTGKNGQQHLDLDVQDIWATVNLDAATIVAHAVYHGDPRQLWLWIAVSGGDFPTQRLCFDTRLGRPTGEGTNAGAVRNGWSWHTGAGLFSICSCLFSVTIGASMSRKLKPYSGRDTALSICDTADIADAGNGFIALIESRPYTPAGLGNLWGTNGDSVLVAGVSPTGSVQLSARVDETAWIVLPVTIVSFAAVSDLGNETRVFPKAALHIAQANSCRIRMFDVGVPAAQWNLDAFIMPVEIEGTR